MRQVAITLQIVSRRLCFDCGEMVIKAFAVLHYSEILFCIFFISSDFLVLSARTGLECDSLDKNCFSFPRLNWFWQRNFI